MAASTFEFMSLIQAKQNVGAKLDVNYVFMLIDICRNKTGLLVRVDCGLTFRPKFVNCEYLPLAQKLHCKVVLSILKRCTWLE